MPRIMVDVYSGYARQDVIVDIPIPHVRPGSWHGNIRARIVDDETQNWYFEVGYNTGLAENRIDVFPVEWCRRPELDDFIGIVPPEALARMREETEAAAHSAT